MSEIPVNPDQTNEPHTQYDRDISLLIHRLETAKTRIRSLASQLNVSLRTPIEETHVSPHQFLARQDPYGHIQAQRLQSELSNYRSNKNRLETLCERRQNALEELKDNV